MSDDSDTLCKAGISYPIAVEIARQMNNGSAGVDNTSVGRLVACGISNIPANALVAQIAAGVYNDDVLCRHLWNPTQAITIAAVGNEVRIVLTLAPGWSFVQ